MPGIRCGGTVRRTCRLPGVCSADVRWVYRGLPDYLERYGTPEHPDDLLHHRCISNRLGDDRVYRWELTRERRNIPNDSARLSDGQSCRNGLWPYWAGLALMYFRSLLLQPCYVEGMDGSSGAYWNGPH